MKKSLIIVLVIGVIICGGLLYLFLQQRSDNSVQTAQDLPATATTKNSKSAKSQPANESNYLVIKEWSVRMKLPNAIHDATYIPKNGRSVWLTTKSVQTIEGCEYSAIVTLERAQKGETMSYGESVEKLMSRDAMYRPTKIGNYYYLGTHSEGGCAENATSKTIAKINAVTTAYMTDALKTLESTK